MTSIGSIGSNLRIEPRALRTSRALRRLRPQRNPPVKSESIVHPYESTELVQKWNNMKAKCKTASTQSPTENT
jgi:hypothetical protein